MATQPRSRTTTSRARGSNSRRQSAGAGRTGSQAENGANAAGDAGRPAIKFVAASMASAAAGAAAGMIGGIVLERSGINRKRRKVLGVSLPGRRDGLSELAKQVGKAGDRFAELAGEVRTTREKVGEAGKALS
jgi:hypothetical protein